MERFLAVLVVVMASSVAHAQFGNPYPVPNSAVVAAQKNYLDKSILDLAMRQQGKRVPRPVINHAPLSVSDFKPGNSRPTVDAFFANAKLGFISMRDFRPIVDRTYSVIEGKLRKNNVASALGFVTAYSMLVARNLNLEDDALDELVANLNDRLARDPAFVNMKASERQALYDSLMLMGAVLVTMNAAGEHDEKIKADAMEMADRFLRGSGTE